jgi:pyruvate oxidase
MARLIVAARIWAARSEGEILNGLLVCPWHGREYDPVSWECSLGEPVQAFSVELREDGIYVGTPNAPTR